jgi:hypothetical protein
MKEEGRRKKEEVYISGFKPQLKMVSLFQSRGIKPPTPG